MNEKYILELIQQQVINTINNYIDLRIKAEDINVFIKNNIVIFQCKGLEYSDTVENLQIAYVFDIKVDAKTAIVLNTATILDKIIFSA